MMDIYIHTYAHALARARTHTHSFDDKILDEMLNHCAIGKIKNTFLKQ